MAEREQRLTVYRYSEVLRAVGFQLRDQTSSIGEHLRVMSLRGEVAGEAEGDRFYTARIELGEDLENFHNDGCGRE